MASNNAAKRAARAYMRNHPGIKYTQALRAVQNQDPEPMSLESLSLYDPHTPMYEQSSELTTIPLLAPLPEALVRVGAHAVITGECSAARVAMERHLVAAAVGKSSPIEDTTGPTLVVCTLAGESAWDEATPPATAQPAAREVVASQIVPVLEWATQEVTRRYDETHCAVTEEREPPVHEELWIVLEDLDYLMALHRQVAELVNWLLRLGRSAGVTVLATVGQSQGIPGGMRDTFAYEIQMRKLPGAGSTDEGDGPSFIASYWEPIQATRLHKVHPMVRSRLVLPARSAPPAPRWVRFTGPVLISGTSTLAEELTRAASAGQ